jgi:hypothetical protein
MNFNSLRRDFAVMPAFIFPAGKAHVIMMARRAAHQSQRKGRK